MTIKEIEMLAEMTRANIRFYEAEGLIAPARNSNGYRDYSEHDLEVLLRIKLLRMLDISLEEIKLLHSGEHELQDTLDKHIAHLQDVKQQVENSQEVCRIMREAREKYETLDAQKYLNAQKYPYVLNYLEQGNEKNQLLEKDQLPKVKAPWKRFFARQLDLSFYGTIWNLVLMLGFNVMLSGRNPMATLILDTLVVSIMLFAVEPLLLTKFGTTPGKWILGLSVTDQDDRYLSYEDSLYRTWQVFRRGMGYGIPVYMQIREYKSLIACQNGQVLDWEQESTLVLKDQKKWRYAAAAGAWLLACGLLALGMIKAESPIHRGDISVAQFSENYNRLAEYMNLDNVYYLDSTGKWALENGYEWDENGDAVKITTNYYGDVLSEKWISMQQVPKFEITEENGVMTGLSFHLEMGDNDQVIQGYDEVILLLVLSYVQAQEGSGFFGKEAKNLLEELFAQAEEEHNVDWTAETFYLDFVSEACGVEVVRKMEYWGYYYFSDLNWLIPNETDDQYYSLTFSMTKK